MFSSEAWLANPSSGFYNSVATQSVRLNDDDSASLQRTFGSAGDRETWTWSAWVKRGNLGGTATLFCASAGDYNFLFYTDNTLKFEGAFGNVVSSSVFRDVTSWYHIVAIHDTTEGTASNRFKIYVNNVLQTLSGTYPSGEGEINKAEAHGIGGQASANYFDGYIAEVNFIDGQALSPTSFGETKEGAWIPKDTSGLTFGTNGFRLQFKQTGTGTASTSTIGADTANSNHFTSSNLASTDSNLPDCPEDNYPTMNILSTGADAITFTEGNLKSSFTSDVDDTHHGCTFALPKEGKWYWEQTFTGADTGGSQAPYCGIYDSDTLALGISDNLFTTSGDFITYYTHNNAIYISGSNTNYTGSIGNQSGAVVGFAVDMDGGHCWVHVNGTYINGTPTFSDGTNKVASPNTDSTYIPFWSGNGGGSMTWEANFGQASFTGTIPTGYSLLTSANLPEPTLGPNSNEQPDDHFNIITWTGNDSTRTLTGVNFQPDLVWIKTRNQGNEHTLFDSSRGVEKHLESNSTAAETTQEQYGYVSAFTADGFTVVTGSSGYHLVNHSSNTFVAWNWKANANSTTTNDASATSVGSEDSTYQANTTAGFSIITYSGTAGTDTIAHGLSQQPDFIIATPRDSAGSNRVVWHKSISTGTFLKLNATDAVATSDQITSVSSTTIGVAGNANLSGKLQVIWCWHEVKGYSKFGKFVGNSSSSDGPYIHLGFKPRWIMGKIASGGTGRWWIFDSKRSPRMNSSLGTGAHLDANASSAEVSDTEVNAVQFLSNGFKVNTGNSEWNNTGYTYIYMAFAEIPEKYSNAF